jgi:hypothetical protein
MNVSQRSLNKNNNNKKNISKVLPSKWKSETHFRLSLPKKKEIRTLVNVRQINY